MIANFHAQALAKIANATLTGCCSRSVDSATQFAKQNNCQAFSSLSEMLESDKIDAVAICSPSGNHLQAAEMAAAAGKHVIIEKPLEVSVERCDRIIQICQKNNVVLSTIFQSRFHHSSALLKDAIRQGRFGKLTLANAYVKWYRTQEYYDSGQWRGTWDLDGGGALMNQAIHNVDLLQWMMGPVVEISAFVATLTHERIEVEDTAVANLRFANGALGTIEATTSAWPGSLKRTEIYGEHGSAIIEDADICKWEFAESTPADTKILESFQNKNTTTGGADDPSALDVSGHVAQFENILSAIHDNQPLMVDGHEARKSVEIIDAIYRSAKTGQIVKL